MGKYLRITEIFPFWHEHSVVELGSFGMKGEPSVFERLGKLERRVEAQGNCLVEHMNRIRRLQSTVRGLEDGPSELVEIRDSIDDLDKDIEGHSADIQKNALALKEHKDAHQSPTRPSDGGFDRTSGSSLNRPEEEIDFLVKTRHAFIYQESEGGFMREVRICLDKMLQQKGI